MIALRLLSRSYCHLCDDMLAALHADALPVAFSVEVVDVDQDPLLLADYDERVHVLLGRTGKDNAVAWIELCQYFFDSQAVREFVVTHAP